MSKSTQITLTEEVTIPLSEISFQFSTSSGPGGQHANRSATRVTLSFNIANSPSLDDDSKNKLLENLATRLDKEGNIQISVQDTRSQIKNRELALERFSELIMEALQEPKERIETKPSALTLTKRKKEKTKKSQRKRERRKDWTTEI